MRRFLAALAAILLSTTWAGPVGAARPVAETPTLAMTPTLAAQGHDGPCTDDVGVTIVVDFQDLGGGVNIRCAPTAPTSGLHALQLAGVSYQTASRSPGFLCRIAGKPSNDPCVVTSPASAYWGYWIAPRGGTWCYSTLGAGNRKPPPGSVEGWSFSLNRTAGAVPTPRYAPPPPIPGTAPSPIPRSHCTTPRGVEPTVPQPPSTQPPAPRPPETRPPATTPPTPGGTPRGPGATAPPGDPGTGTGGDGGTHGSDDGGGGPRIDTRDDGGPEDPDGDEPGSPADGGDDDPVDGGDPEGDDDDEAEAEDEPDGADTETASAETPIVPTGDVDLTTDGSSDGSPIGVIVTAVILAVVGCGAAWRYRSTRRSPSSP